MDTPYEKLVKEKSCTTCIHFPNDRFCDDNCCWAGNTLRKCVENVKWEDGKTDDPVARRITHKEGTSKALDTQVGGGHYKEFPIQPVEFIVKNKLGYREGNVVKYISRHPAKNGIEDVRKAMHYCQMIIDSYVEGEL